MVSSIGQFEWGFETAVRTLWQECRGDSLQGQKAVAHVIVNRLASGRWGHSYGEVVLAPLQFSGWNNSDHQRELAAALPDDDPLLEALRHVLAEVEQEYDLTSGATHYYAPAAMVPHGRVPKWVAKARFDSKSKIWTAATYCGKFGSQLFYKGVD